MMQKIILTAVITFFVLQAPTGDRAHAEDALASSIVIEQESTSGVFSSWTLIKPRDQLQSSTSQSVIIENAESGNYTLIAKIPKGYDVQLLVFSGAVLTKTLDVPQINFHLNQGDSIRISLHYFLSRIGRISVSSDPANLRFVITGPNNFREEGTTPGSFLDVPEGQYTVQYDVPEGCGVPPQQSHLLKMDKQISFSVSIRCDAADRMREEQKNPPRSEEFVTVRVDGKEIALTDVLKTAWYAGYVVGAAEQNILSGYRNEDGTPTGKFGPENVVSLAELAKIAHRLGGIDETLTKSTPRNVRANSQWYEDYIASAEEHGWPAFADITQDLTRPATRGEVLMTLLQAMDIPLRWQKGSIFLDVTMRTPYAAAIETAHVEGFVSGRKDEAGNDTGIFGPTDPINRAELSKIIQLMIQKYRM